MQRADSTPQWYKQFWPWFIILLPASVVVAGIATVIIAFKNEDGLVNDDYYKEGLAINRQLYLEQRAEQMQLGASVKFDLYTGELRVVLAGKLQLWPQAIRLQLSHPTDQQQDLSLVLKRTELKDYMGQLEQAIGGRWYIQLTDTERTQWRLNGDINLSDSVQTELGYPEMQR